MRINTRNKALVTRAPTQRISLKSGSPLKNRVVDSPDTYTYPFSRPYAPPFFYTRALIRRRDTLACIIVTRDLSHSLSRPCREEILNATLKEKQ